MNKLAGNISPQVEALEHETVGGLTGKGAKRTVGVPLTQRLAYNGSNNIEYIGEALQGSSEGASVWRIRKLIYDGDNPVAINYASGSPEFSFSWTNRASFTYS